jgi:hypothetical protein
MLNLSEKTTMIDEKFSKKSFSDAGLNTPESKKLADQLAQEIQAKIHISITQELNNIVENLNCMGHNLRLYEDIQPGDISYRDDNDEDGSNYECYLRLAVDTIISTGYSHLHKFDSDIS